jgi:elongation factor G
VEIDVVPLEPGTGLEIEEEITGGAIPREFIKPAQDGIREALESGVLAGYPITDVRVTLVDGSYHEVDSSEMAFKIAGSIALKEAVQRGRPVLLEPVMEVEVISPEEYTGDVIGNLSAQRGEIEGMEMRGENIQAVHANVPLAEMFGYATKLRSMTQGRGTFTMELDHYAPVPESLAQKVLKGGA